MASYRPPFELTPAIVRATGAIERLLGRFEGLHRPPPAPALRRNTAVKTVQATLAIEGEIVSDDQVTALLEGKRVTGPPHDLLAAKNAIEVYRRAAKFRPGSEEDLLAAHRLLMDRLVADAGKFRKGNVGVLAGSRVAHVAPPAKRVPGLVADLLGFVRGDRATHPLVKSAVVHYELEFIHPFSDGNGRMGRLWQHVSLVRFDEAFANAPVETIVRERQAEYYAALAVSDRTGSATPFVEFSLETVEVALAAFLAAVRPVRLTASDRIDRAREHFVKRSFSRRDYLALHAPLSSAAASRDLAAATAEGRLAREGDKATARYRFVR